MPGSRWSTPNKLRQLQYRSYIYEATIFHYPNSLLPFRHFEARLTRRDHGYIARLLGEDTMSTIPKPEGDETPPGFYEVAYLLNIFQNRGSALGFRVVGPAHANDRIEWLCFERSVLKELEMWVVESHAPRGGLVPLFDKVGTISRAALAKRGTVTGHAEHRAWFDSLNEAIHPVVRLTITYVNWRRDKLKEEREEEMLAAAQLGEMEATGGPLMAKRPEKKPKKRVHFDLPSPPPGEDIEMQDADVDDTMDMEDDESDEMPGLLVETSLSAAQKRERSTRRMELQANGAYV